MVDGGWNHSHQRPEVGRSGSGLALGAAAGLIAALAGAILWTVIVEVTGYRIGFAAVGLGLLVGQAVALTTATSRQLPAVAALFALFGCVLGEVFVDAHQLASVLGIGTPTMLWHLITHPDLLGDVFAAGFSPRSIAFWAIAAGAGYRLAARATDRQSTGPRPSTGSPLPRAVAGPEFTGPSLPSAAAYPAASAQPVPSAPVPARPAARHPSDFFSAPSAPRFTARARQAALAEHGLPTPAGPGRAPRISNAPRPSRIV